MLLPLLLLPAVVCVGGGRSSLTAAAAASSSSAGTSPPWVPPPADSPLLMPFLHDTSRPKLAFSTWVGWYMGGGLNETSLFAQVEAMADKLRPHGWTHILHDCESAALTLFLLAGAPALTPTLNLSHADGWQVCGSTYSVQEGCIHVDAYGRLYPSWERYPSTTIGGNLTTGSWKPFTDRVHAKGLAYGLHLMHGIPKLAVNKKLPIINSSYTADEIVSTPLCATFIPDHWAINSSHPGAQLYYDSVISKWAEEGIDFIYLDGIVGANMAKCGCHVAAAELVSDSLRRLGNGMHLFISAGPPDMSIGCPFEVLTELAPYVRVGSDTVDSWAGSIEAGFSKFTRLTAPSIGPHHFGDLASLMVVSAGHPHVSSAAQFRSDLPSYPLSGLPVSRHECHTALLLLQGHCHRNGEEPGPDYYIPSAESHMTEDEVFSYASMVAIFRSTWWPSGVLSDMTNFQMKLLTNDDVIRVTMASSRTRQVIDASSKSFAGPGIVWTADDDVDTDVKYLLLVNLGANTTRVAVELPQLGIPAAHACLLSELWNGTVLGRSAVGSVAATLRSHASLFVKISSCARLKSDDDDDGIAATCADPTDCTDDLQRAIFAAHYPVGSGRLLVPPLPNSAPWIVRPIFLNVSDVRITFAPGVEVLAMRDQFRGERFKQQK
jgi:alpha-galactosidase